MSKWMMLVLLGLAVSGAQPSAVVTDDWLDDATIVARMPQRRTLVNEQCLSVAFKCWAELQFIDDPNLQMLALWVIDEYLKAGEQQL